MARKPATPRRKPARKAPANETPDEGRAHDERGTSPWEWAAAGVGAAILAVILGFLVYEGVTRPPGAQPEIMVTGGSTVPLASGGFLVPIRIENHGDVTGANVSVNGALLGPDGATIEESSVAFDFVAQHSRETGGLYFTADPRAYRLTLRVEGYADP
jgi:uncharacterized protein (TIGR02588 family)